MEDEDGSVIGFRQVTPPQIATELASARGLSAFSQRRVGGSVLLAIYWLIGGSFAPREITWSLCYHEGATFDTLQEEVQ